MRYVASILNIALICVLSYFLAERGLPNNNEILIIGLAFIAPITSLLALYPKQNHSGWISLYFERKRLEEQIKIDQIRSSKRT